LVITGIPRMLVANGGPQPAREYCINVLVLNNPPYCPLHLLTFTEI